MSPTRRAEEGEPVTLQDPRRRSYQFTVAASCHGREGHWACAAHPDVAIPNNLSMSGHVEGPGSHVEVWICHVHGPEAP